jgi:hypothetical protein
MTAAQKAARNQNQTCAALRRFAQLLAGQDPEALAAQIDVTTVAATIADVAQVDLFFRRYVRALRARKAA